MNNNGNGCGCCRKCPHFNKNIISRSKNKIRYGCSASLDGFTVFAKKESDFDVLVCDFSKNTKQISINEILQL